MLVLFETPAGYALFKVSNTAAVASAATVAKHFTTSASAAEVIKLKAFSKFADTTSALSAATAICDGKLDKSLKSFLSDAIGKKGSAADELAVSDAKLGGLIKEKLSIPCIYNDTVHELMRGIRQHMGALIAGLSPSDTGAMKLGLSHSLCRYKLKFSPDKVDTMIIQAISLLDELDKELNTYAMRVREWYGWHFPEMGKIVTDNIMYAKVVRKMEIRTAAHNCDLSDILPEEVEQQLKEAAEVSMGTEIAEEDVLNIKSLCEQVVSISEYRASLYEYLRNRMNAIAPNLTVMVGELVGARLIAHAGSLLSLAKHPASTVQILGAEKALFRALKTKHDTPKYGLIYHASLVGQAAPKNKGKISRMLAAKTALSIRMDALGESDQVTVGFTGREKVELRLKTLEGGATQAASGKKPQKQQSKYQKPTTAAQTYNASNDVQMTPAKSGVKSEAPAAAVSVKKEKTESAPAEVELTKEQKKAAKADKKRKAEAIEEPAAEPEAKKAKKSKSTKKDKKKSDD